MNKGFTLLAAVALGCMAANAVPAKPGLRTIVQPDGSTVVAELRGDEFCSFYMTPEGLPMQMDAQGYLRYVVADSEGTITLSDNAASVNVDAAMSAFARIGKAERLRMDPDRSTVADAARAVVRAAEGDDDALPQKGMGLMGRQNFPTQGDIKSIVILVQYKDVSFTVKNPTEYYKNMLNQEGFDQYGGVGSARDFFVENSAGQFRPQFDVYGPITTQYKRSYYGAQVGNRHDSNPSAMVLEACKQLDATVDFSQYDLDGDGMIDNIYVIYAGQGQATYGGSDTVWPHSATISNGPVYDGVRVGRYATSNEWEYQRPDGIGTFVHEFSHVMGLPDLYSTAYANSVTPGAWSTMDQGPYNGDGCRPAYYTAFERNALGWIDLKVLDSPSNVTLPDISNNEAYIIPTMIDTEFFLLENRQQRGWDTDVPGHGLLVWHIDFDKTVFNLNNVNNDETHQYVDIVEASNAPNSSSSYAQSRYTFPGPNKLKKSITPKTTPCLQPWIGPAIDMYITKINEVSVQESNDITFEVDGGIAALETPVATEATGIGANGFTATWNAVEGASKYLLTVIGENLLEDEGHTLDFGQPADTRVVLPEGWTFSGAETDIYTASSFCGASRPSLKFEKNATTLTSPLYNGEVGKVSFFLRAANASASSALDIQGRNSEAENWISLDRVSNLSQYNTRGTNVECDLTEKHVRQIRFVFYAASGKMALDDIVVELAGNYSAVVENYDGKDVGDAVSHNVAIAPEGTGIYSYFVKAVDSDNYTTKASNTITVDLSQFVSGVENVIAESQWNVAVNGRTATYAGTPGAAVRLVSISGATIAETTADASGNATVEIPAAGVYLVATPQGTIKAVVR